MKLQTLLLSACLLSINVHLFAQDNSLNQYNFQLKTSTIIPAVDFDNTKTSDKTISNLGLFNDEIELLSQEVPTENLFPGSLFRMKEIASNDFILQNYPIRTSIKMLAIVNDSIYDGCSGSMVSNKHVISSAHCFESYNTGQIIVDSILICPVYNFGEIDPYFGCTYVSKAYYPTDWKAKNYDLILFETEDNIGAQTGWLGIGFNENDSYFEGQIGHKYSYPAKTIFQLDPRTYNGDTLYHSYGQIDFINSYSLNFLNTNGIPGESGSSLLIQEEDFQFTTYGQLNWSNNLSHSRIQKDAFYAFKAILDPFLTNTNAQKEIIVSIFPNPTADLVYVKSDKDVKQIILYNEVGILLQKTKGQKMDLTNYASGVYFLQVETAEGTLVKKIIKQSL